MFKNVFFLKVLPEAYECRKVVQRSVQLLYIVPSSVKSHALNLAENAPYKVSSMFTPTSLRSRTGLVLHMRIHSSTIWPKQGVCGRVKFIRGAYIQELDLEIMEVLVVKEVETVELHVACYTERQALWSHLKRSKKLGKMIEFLKNTFCELFSGHSTGAERFGRLLAAWYQRTGALVCAPISTQSCSELWRALTCDFNGAVSR